MKTMPKTPGTKMHSASAPTTLAAGSVPGCVAIPVTA
jgi:hypothetical protein